jgi:hypothetical protein
MGVIRVLKKYAKEPREAHGSRKQGSMQNNVHTVIKNVLN